MKSLGNRMELWHAEEIMQLLKEAETIQKDLRVSNTLSTIAEISEKLTCEMRKGNMNSVVKLLADNMQIGVLPLNDQTLFHIKQNTRMVKRQIQRYCYQIYQKKFTLLNSIR